MLTLLKFKKKKRQLENLEHLVLESIINFPNCDDSFVVMIFKSLSFHKYTKIFMESIS